MEPAHRRNPTPTEECSLVDKPIDNLVNSVPSGGTAEVEIEYGKNHPVVSIHSQITRIKNATGYENPRYPGTEKIL